MSEPEFNLGVIADIPSNTDWDQQFTLYEPGAVSDDADYSAVLDAADEVRCRVWDDSDAPTLLLSFVNGTASDGGSTVEIVTRGVTDTTPAQIIVKFAADDLNMTKGMKVGVIEVKDASEPDAESDPRWHVACIFRFRILAGPIA